VVADRDPEEQPRAPRREVEIAHLGERLIEILVQPDRDRIVRIGEVHVLTLRSLARHRVRAAEVQIPSRLLAVVRELCVVVHRVETRLLQIGPLVHGRLHRHGHVDIVLHVVGRIRGLDRPVPASRVLRLVHHPAQVVLRVAHGVLRDDDALLAVGHLGLGLRDLDRRQGADLHLDPVELEQLLGEAQRFLGHAQITPGEDELPVGVLGGLQGVEHLLAELALADRHVVAGDHDLRFVDLLAPVAQQRLLVDEPERSRVGRREGRARVARRIVLHVERCGIVRAITQPVGEGGVIGLQRVGGDEEPVLGRLGDVVVLGAERQVRVEAGLLEDDVLLADHGRRPGQPDVQVVLQAHPDGVGQGHLDRGRPLFLRHRHDRHAPDDKAGCQHQRALAHPHHYTSLSLSVTRKLSARPPPPARAETDRDTRISTYRKRQEFPPRLDE